MDQKLAVLFMPDDMTLTKETSTADAAGPFCSAPFSRGWSKN